MLRALLPGRRADVLMLHTDQPLANRRVDQTIFKFGGVAIAGIEKLAAKVALRLLTPRGGLPYSEIEGCQLINDAIAGRLRTDEMVLRSFALSREHVLDQFAADAQNRRDTPLDEQLQDLRLLSVRVYGGEVELKIEVISRSGGRFELIQPIEIA